MVSAGRSNFSDPPIAAPSILKAARRNAHATVWTATRCMPSIRPAPPDQDRGELAVVGVPVRQDIALDDSELLSLLDHRALGLLHIGGVQDFTQEEGLRRRQSPAQPGILLGEPFFTIESLPLRINLAHHVAKHSRLAIGDRLDHSEIIKAKQCERALKRRDQVLRRARGPCRDGGVKDRAFELRSLHEKTLWACRWGRSNRLGHKQFGSG